MPDHKLPPFLTMKRHLFGVTNVVAVASGKGGVGKTTSAVNLALALARRGAAVGLYDADLYGPNVPYMLGVTRQKSVPDFVPIARREAEPYIRPLERYGLKVMSIGLLMATEATIMPAPETAGQVIRQTMQDVKWGVLDYLIVDLPPGTGEPQHTLLNTIHFDGVVMVTTPQDLSLMDSSRALGLFHEASVPVLGLIENMSYIHCPHCGEPVEIFHRSDREWRIQGDDIDLLGRVPMDMAFSKGIDAEHPLVSKGAEAGHAKIYHEIAAKVVEKLTKDDAKS